MQRPPHLSVRKCRGDLADATRSPHSEHVPALGDFVDELRARGKLGRAEDRLNSMRGMPSWALSRLAWLK